MFVKEKKNLEWTEDSFTLHKNTGESGSVFYTLYLHRIESVTTREKKYADDDFTKGLSFEATRRDGKRLCVDLVLFTDDKKKLVFKRGKE